MTKREIIDVLADYGRPGSPNFEYHFRGLSDRVLKRRNAEALLAILQDSRLPAKVRDHAAGALGEIGHGAAASVLIEALGETETRRGAAFALGRMKVRKARARLKEWRQNVPVARWAYSQLGPADSVTDIVDGLCDGALRYIRETLEGLSEPVRRKVMDEIVRRLRDSLPEGDSHLRAYVTAFGVCPHSEAPELLASVLDKSWRDMGDRVGRRTKGVCCGCTHMRTLRALKTNPSVNAVPNLVATVTNRYQLHAPLALQRLAEFEGGGLSDKQIAEMLRKSAAIRDPQGRHTLPQVIRFVGRYGGPACLRTLKKLREEFTSGREAEALDSAAQAISRRQG